MKRTSVGNRGTSRSRSGAGTTSGRKRCRMCGRSKPLTAFWRRGADRWCSICRSGYFRNWVATHRDAYDAWKQAYVERNREHIRAYQRAYQRRRRALMRDGEWKSRRLSTARAR